ncbi:hypothetical protein NKI34_29070 [Mesorhizobium sp. M0700]|uniref:hypothetical protein n=1 Tax=Mesorhizobium sp. M0700 TaxID=2956988 RepID=UPI00333BFF62
MISESSRDYRRAVVKLRIRYGGSGPNEREDLLLGDVIYLVCGPIFAHEHRDATAKCLPELPVLHVEWIEPGWAVWEEVLGRARIRQCR